MFRRRSHRSWRLERLEDRTAPAVFTVTSLADDGSSGTLRAAVVASNASPDPADTINIVIPGTITLQATNGALAVTKANGTLTIDGFTSGAGTTITIQNGADRLFLLTSSVGTTDVTLVNLSLTGGSAGSASTFGAFGGAIYNTGRLALNGCAVTSNSAIGAAAPGGQQTAFGQNGQGGGIASVGTLGTLVLQNTQVTNNRAVGGDATGLVAAFGGSALGGGLYIESGPVTVVGGSIAGNTAQGGQATASTNGQVIGGAAQGGGIELANPSSGPDTLTGVTLSNNIARGGTVPLGGTAGSGQGGGLDGGGPITISASLIQGNSAIGDSAQGGGLNMVGGPLTIDRTTVAGNVAQATGGGDANGGGLRSIGSPDGALITNSTFSGNRAISANANARGGAISSTAFSTTSPDRLFNSTITSNSAQGSATNGTAEGGGAFVNLNPEAPVPLTIGSTIVAGNTIQALTRLGPDVAGQFTSAGNNLIGDGGQASGLVNGVNGDQVGTAAAPIDPLLGPLTDNGGGLPTHALLAGSPAIGRGNNSQNLATDQRGPGFPRVFGGAVDVGALEFDPPPVAVADTFTTTAGQTLTVPAPGVLANDSDPVGLGLTAVLATAPAIGTLTLGPDGSLTYVPAAGASGIVTFTYSVRDGANATSAPATVTVNVRPTAAPQSFAVPFNTPLNRAAPGVLTGAVGTGLTVALVAPPTLGQLTLNADGSFTYQPNTGSTGSDSFTFQAVDSAGLRSAPALVSLTVLPFILVGPGVFATGADFGGGPHVKLFNPDGRFRFSFYAYDEPFRGGVRVALADVTGDGVRDIITAAGYFGGPHIKVFDGTDGRLIRSFYAYDPTFSGGVFVAGGDVDGDGHADIITGAGGGGGPHVKIFSGADGHLLASFYAYDPTFSGGVHVAAGDTDGDGQAEVITGPGFGSAPVVKLFDANGDLLRQFTSGDPAFAGGVWVSAGDLDGDGKAEIITGAGPEGPPTVRVFDGVTLAKRAEFDAFAPYKDPGVIFSGGVRVAVDDVNNDGRDEIVAAAGPGGGPHVRIFDGVSNAELLSIYAYDPAFLPPFGGVFVG